MKLIWAWDWTLFSYVIFQWIANISFKTISLSYHKWKKMCLNQKFHKGPFEIVAWFIITESSSQKPLSSSYGTRLDRTLSWFVLTDGLWFSNQNWPWLIVLVCFLIGWNLKYVFRNFMCATMLHDRTYFIFIDLKIFMIVTAEHALTWDAAFYVKICSTMMLCICHHQIPNWCR
jgi:hypothetical protein